MATFSCKCGKQFKSGNSYWKHIGKCEGSSNGGDERDRPGSKICAEQTGGGPNSITKEGINTHSGASVIEEKAEVQPKNTDIQVEQISDVKSDNVTYTLEDDDGSFVQEDRGAALGLNQIDNNDWIQKWSTEASAHVPADRVSWEKKPKPKPREETASSIKFNRAFNIRKNLNTSPAPTAVAPIPPKNDDILAEPALVHENQVNQLKKYACRICASNGIQVIYNTAQGLSMHRSSKHKEKRVCLWDGCGGRFSSNSTLNRHVRVVHKLEDSIISKRRVVEREGRVKCETCGNDYAGDRYLKRHLKGSYCGKSEYQSLLSDNEQQGTDE